jgi:hypothetical protein
LKRDVNEVATYLGSIHECIAILVFAFFFFAFNSFVVNEGIVEVVLVFAIIFFLFFFNMEVTISAAAKIAHDRLIIRIVVDINYFGKQSLDTIVVSRRLFFGFSRSFIVMGFHNYQWEEGSGHSEQEQWLEEQGSGSGQEKLA